MYRANTIAVCILLLSTLLPACLQRKGSGRDQRFGKLLKNSMTQDKALSDGSEGLKLLDPNNAKVDPGAVSVNLDGDFEGIQVPMFSLRFTDSDYAIILRCRESFRKTLSAQLADAEDISRMGGGYDELPWVWNDAFGNRNNCRVVHSRYKGPKFQDIAAPSGRFFYVLNPCVSRERALKSARSRGTEYCSYALQMTDQVEYQSRLKDVFRQQAILLVDAEGRYEALVSRLSLLSNRLIKMKEQCAVTRDVAAKDYKSQETSRVRASSEQLGEARNWAVGLGAAGVVAAFGARALLKGAGGKLNPQRTVGGVLTGFAALGALGGSGYFVSQLFSHKDPRSEVDFSFDECAQDRDFDQEGFKKIVNEIESLKSELGPATKRLVDISKKLREIDQRFKGYDQLINDSQDQLLSPAFETAK